MQILLVYKSGAAFFYIPAYATDHQILHSSLFQWPALYETPNNCMQYDIILSNVALWSLYIENFFKDFILFHFNSNY